MSQRITAYIKQYFGEDVLAEVVSGKRTVTINDVAVDGTVKNFRDKRVTIEHRVHISTDAIEQPTESLSEIFTPEETVVKVPIDESLIVSDDERPVVDIPAPVVELTVRTKRYYARLRDGKSIPSSTPVHTSKSGKQFYVKVIGEERYV